MAHIHHHTHLPAGDESSERYQDMRQVTLVGALVNIALAGLKLVFGFLGQSQALIADGIHSLSDLFSDLLVLWAAKQGSQDPDEEHPYGHARFETVATVILAVFLIIVAVGLVIDSANRLRNPELLMQPGGLALAVAIISILANELLFHYTIRTADKLRSDLLRANAWHHRSDAISSVIVMLGIGGAMAGFPVFDAIGAVLVALMIAHIGWSLGQTALKQLVDTGLDAERLGQIRSVIRETPGVEQLHMLRTRSMGSNALVDVHILVPARVSVSEGHMISEKVRERLEAEFEEITGVMVHIDPEDDEVQACDTALPNRAEVIRHLQQCWQDIGVDVAVADITLHYLNGGIEVDVILPLSEFHDIAHARELGDRLSEETCRAGRVHRVRVYFH